LVPIVIAQNAIWSHGRRYPEKLSIDRQEQQDNADDPG
jgi:hypothetical protein